MCKEITVEMIENCFDNGFKEIDKSEHLKSERNSYSLKQIMEAYEESKNY